MAEETLEGVALDAGQIHDDDVLLRRVFRDFAPPRADGVRRLSKSVFGQSSDGSGMSVVVRRRLIELGCTDEDLLRGYPDHGLAELRVGDVRAMGLEVHWDPGEEDDCVAQAHAEVTGDDDGKMRNRLRAAATVNRWPN